MSKSLISMMIVGLTLTYAVQRMSAVPRPRIVFN
jgi:hypothetical protein